ncbi:DUF1127 domain-containing protein [Thioclava sp. SK-1]|uniref:DUF1127 domain-containing protein n=1 Tax=Thioclava sp. SK-1 TaxID=1889770 RepID=UPI0021018C66|nr:DUF1127 domain-containing protein [Thioclava sp. SK-1]
MKMFSLTQRKNVSASVPVLRLLRVVTTQIQMHRSRQALKHLDTHLLKDIGLTEFEAASESQRQIWS